ncbi:MAG: molecular chaperone TorD family protein [Candidatus Baltobacteraceae bacterium]
MAVLAETPQAAHAEIRAALSLQTAPSAAEHAELFAFNLYPYASVYLGAEGMLGGEARDRIAGFWRALGLVPPSEPDHLVALLGLYASLREREASEADDGRRLLIAHARDTLLAEHVAPWAFAYLDKVRELGAPFYRAWATLACEALVAEGVEGGNVPGVPIVVREVPTVDGDDGDLDAFLNSLLAFARSGAILTRADLRRAGERLGLAVRHGERRYILRALLSQDAPATLRWLREEADAWATRHETLLGAPAAVRAHGATRARRTAEVLAVAAEQAGDFVEPRGGAIL